ncbi:MAG: Asp-tRNA(Asn)/Glu-tRNA(Gln) amidotransferase subunit GatC [Patescibacteria group bacterium]
MARLTKKDVIHVAELSNLKLTDSEIKKFLPQLTKIVEFVGSLTEVNTENIEPTSQTTGLTNVVREDRVISENMLTQEDYFKVPAILTERT